MKYILRIFLIGMINCIILLWSLTMELDLLLKELYFIRNASCRYITFCDSTLIILQNQQRVWFIPLFRELFLLHRMFQVIISYGVGLCSVDFNVLNAICCQRTAIWNVSFGHHVDLSLIGKPPWYLLEKIAFVYQYGFGDYFKFRHIAKCCIKCVYILDV